MKSALANNDDEDSGSCGTRRNAHTKTVGGRRPVSGDRRFRRIKLEYLLHYARLNISPQQALSLRAKCPDANEQEFSLAEPRCTIPLDMVDDVVVSINCRIGIIETGQPLLTANDAIASGKHKLVKALSDEQKALVARLVALRQDLQREHSALSMRELTQTGKRVAAP